MRTIRSAQSRAVSDTFGQGLTDAAMKVFQVSIVVALGLYGYILYGLFSGALAVGAGTSHAEIVRVTALVQQLGLWLQISVLITLISSIIVFHDHEIYGWTLVLTAAFLAFGLKYVMDMLGASDRLSADGTATLALTIVHRTALYFGAPGIVAVLRSLYLRFANARYGDDLASMQYGSAVARQDVPRALIGAFARCWQLPFCREGIRIKCPIYHARTKCWQQRVGCMCEENIIRVAMADTTEQPAGKANPLQDTGAFVPIGDLLTKSEATMKTHVPTRPGPRGVRIPTNPHLSPLQKRDRCRNCVIYNEHQRQKYQLLSPIVTLVVPLLVFWQFDTLRDVLKGALGALDNLIHHISFAQSAGGASDLTRNVTSSVPVEAIIIVCFTLIAMTWALRFLEYCTFKIKI